MLAMFVASCHVLCDYVAPDSVTRRQVAQSPKNPSVSHSRRVNRYSASTHDVVVDYVNATDGHSWTVAIWSKVHRRTAARIAGLGDRQRAVVLGPDPDARPRAA